MLRFRIQSTPNPSARKYIVSEDLKSEGKVSFRDPSECAHIPMAHALLSLNSIRQVHLFQNVVTITQDGSQSWADIDVSVQSIISETFSSHDPDFVEKINTSADNISNLNPELKKIDYILDQTIRPSLQMDGGDVELVSLEGDILTLKYLGACGGCPSAMTGTLDAIRSTLADRYGENLEVLAL